MGDADRGALAVIDLVTLICVVATGVLSLRQIVSPAVA